MKELIMKLIYRIAVITFIACLVIMTYMMMTPDHYGNLKQWYKAHNIDHESHEDLQHTVELPEQQQHLEEQHLADAHKLNEEFNHFFKLRPGTKNMRKKKKKKKRKRPTYVAPRKEQQQEQKNIKVEFDRKDEKENIKIKENVDRGTNNDRAPYRILPNPDHDENVKNTSRKVKKRKIILIYTSLHKVEKWYNLPQSKLKGYLKATKCKYQNCLVTYDKNLYTSADAVIFHERNMPGESLLNRLSTIGYRPLSQRWIFFTSETPKNTEDGVIPYNGYFNWTMTYKTDSDIYLPYLQYRKLRKKDPRPDPNIDYAKGKSRSVAWLVGNCKFEFRMEFVYALEHFTSVYVGGGCRDEFQKKIECTPWCDQRALDDYKFYLSLENGICTDYISEKYWRYLEQGLVPIVLGGANYSNPKLAIPGSFIDASKFKTIADLASYIEYLDGNDTAYNEYFKWKQKYRIWHPLEGDWPFESYFLCKICGMLQRKLPTKIYDYLSDFWDEETDCNSPEEKMRKRIDFSGYSWEARIRRKDKEARDNAARIPKDFDEEHDNNFDKDLELDSLA